MDISDAPARHRAGLFGGTWLPEGHQRIQLVVTLFPTPDRHSCPNQSLASGRVHYLQDMVNHRIATTYPASAKRANRFGVPTGFLFVNPKKELMLKR